ncbi:hypothetical protein [Undibacterium terreum]|uniref:hypothetical protein n=1 Tax=Undibacterium terreum TaxID=1224302 RepID=UPI001667E5FA|nr:hypothetical protein [Undibacterium terreum]
MNEILVKPGDTENQTALLKFQRSAETTGYDGEFQHKNPAQHLYSRGKERTMPSAMEPK